MLLCHLVVKLVVETRFGKCSLLCKKKGYAEELQESDLTLDSLEEKLSHLLSHKEDYQAKMKASKELKSLADFYQLLKKDLS